MRDIKGPTLPRLYIISDSSRSVEPIAKRLIALMEAGAGMIQIREKGLTVARRIELILAIKPVAYSNKTLLIINERIDLAIAYGLDGVHLGIGSLPVPVARRLLGPDALIGFSAHSREELNDAHREGADFATLSPIFATPKPYPVTPIGIDILSGSGTPPPDLRTFALGGIDVETIGSLRDRGFYGVACMGAAMVAPQAGDFVLTMIEQLSHWR